MSILDLRDNTNMSILDVRDCCALKAIIHVGFARLDKLGNTWVSLVRCSSPPISMIGVGALTVSSLTSFFRYDGARPCETGRMKLLNIDA